MRRLASKALGGIGPAAISSLIETLSDPDNDVREQAAKALGDMGPIASEAVPALAKVLLRDPNNNVRIRAAEALAMIGQAAGEAVSTLIKALGSTTWQIRVYALRTLVMIGPTAVPALIKAIGSSHKSYIRMNAAEALGEIRPVASEAIPILNEALRDQDQAVREKVANALREIQQLSI